METGIFLFFKQDFRKEKEKQILPIHPS